MSLPFVVVLADLRAEAHLLERHVHLVSAIGPRLAFLFVAPLAVVHHPAHRRLDGARNDDEIEVAGVCVRPRLVGGADTELLALCTDEAHLTGADLIVDLRGHPWGAIDRSRCSFQRRSPFSN